VIEFCNLAFSCEIVVSRDMLGNVMRPPVTSGVGERI
jgi:hypothetical protein